MPYFQILLVVQGMAEDYLPLVISNLLVIFFFLFFLKSKKKLKEYKLPPMLIQPIVENSILHGISPLKDREGLIEIFINEKENYLNITVKDNGIGIKASQKLKRQNNKTDQLHKSYATQILKERIDVFNYLKNKK